MTATFDRYARHNFRHRRAARTEAAQIARLGRVTEKPVRTQTKGRGR